MEAYKTNLQPTFVLYRSPELLKYVQEVDPTTTKALEPVKTTDCEQLSEGKLPTVKQQEKGVIDKKNLKDDYQKNITINVVKCCIREMLSKHYQKLIKKKCEKRRVPYEDLVKFIQPVLKEVVISLGDLKKLLTSGDSNELRLKSVFGWFLEWYLRHKYMSYLLNEGKMNYKERYIEYKNKYILYLLEMIREEREQQLLQREQQELKLKQQQIKQEQQPNN